MSYINSNCLFFLAIVGLALPSQAEVITRGKIYKSGSGRQDLLFLFEQDRQEKQGVIIKKSVYRDAKTNADLVEEEAEFSVSDGAEALTRFRQQHKQTGADGSVEVKDGRAIFKYTVDGKTKESEEKTDDTFVVAPSIVPYLQTHWAKIDKGEKVNMRFAVIDRRETVGFQFSRVEEKSVDGKKQVILKMRPTSFIIAAIVNPLFFTFSEGGAQLLSIDGRVAPKIKKGNSFVDVDAETVYEHFQLSGKNSK